MNAPTPPTEAKGHIIFLNGISSAGKTSIAKILQRILGETTLHMTLEASSPKIANIPEICGIYRNYWRINTDLRNLRQFDRYTVHSRFQASNKSIFV
jgi:hypothetical protein